jgi:hypothetical protein
MDSGVRRSDGIETFYETINNQCSKRLSAGGGLNFGHWNLFEIWDLLFGALETGLWEFLNRWVPLFFDFHVVFRCTYPPR